MKRLKKKVLMPAILLLIGMLLPVAAMAQDGPLSKIFNSIKLALAPVSTNKPVILGIVGVIGLVLAIIAWGSEMTSQNPQLTKLIKGFVLLLVFLEVLFIFVA